MLNEKFIQNLNEEAIQKLDCAQSEEEFRSILSENGVTAEEIERLVEYLKRSPEELSVDDLDTVAGGASCNYNSKIHKWAWKFLQFIGLVDKNTCPANNP